MTTSITIKIDDEELLKRLEAEAKLRATDVATIVRELIEEEFCPARPNAEMSQYRDLDEFAGTWTAEDVEEFRRNTADFEKIDEELWQ